jgi:hypothetical protein
VASAGSVWGDARAVPGVVRAVDKKEIHGAGVLTCGSVHIQHHPKAGHTETPRRPKTTGYLFICASRKSSHSLTVAIFETHNLNFVGLARTSLSS